MTHKPADDLKSPARRRLFGAAGGLTALAVAGRANAQATPAAAPAATSAAPPGREPFWGMHQAGIITPAQQHMVFAAFDLVTVHRDEVAAVLKAWTEAAARMALGQPAQAMQGGFAPVPHEIPAKAPGAYDEEAPDWAAVGADTGEAEGLPASRLTVTFGFGAGLFTKDGQDRYGLSRLRPAALVELPKFTGDQLVESISGGDLSVQACADDPQVAFHAVRQLARLAEGIAALRWIQNGFLPDTPSGQTPRNLMGFRDGTANPSPDDPAAMDRFVWAGTEGPEWMHGGSYQVNRRIRIALERWDRMKTSFQEETVGRFKESGAPLGAKKEFDKLPLDATNDDGDPVIAENAHVRLATAATNDGAQILRRGYAYNDGLSMTAERWPPWHQGLEYDAGLLFVAYQRDPRTGFIRIFERMAKFDMMNQFVTHVSSGLFACPRGAAPGEYIGQRLFEMA